MDQTAIIGHQSICRFLENALEKQAESHAYLFLGQALVGKGTVARWFADKILGGAQAGRNFAWLDPEKGIQIADIRKLRTDLSLTNPFGKYRVAVLRRAEQMTPPAQNAFLKVLEEPKTAVVFILTAETLKGLLPTVISRVQIVRFAPVPEAVIAGALQHDGVVPEVAKRAARLAVGCPGKAVQLCQGENLRLAEEKRREIIRLFSLLPHARFKMAYRLLDDDQRVEAEQLDNFLTAAEGVWRDLWLGRAGWRDDLTRLGLESDLVALLPKISPAQISSGLRAIRRWRYLRERNVNKKLSLERLMLSAFPKTYP